MKEIFMSLIVKIIELEILKLIEMTGDEETFVLNKYIVIIPSSVHSLNIEQFD